MVTDHFMTLDGLDFHYRDWGGQGHTIVLVHGLASTCHIWDLVAPRLTHKFKVVALDQRGHGETDQPDNNYDFVSVAQDLHKFTTALELGQPTLIGHSWGGNVALQYSVMFPNSIASLILVDGGTIEPSNKPGYTWERARKEMTPPSFTNMTLDDLLQRATKRWLGSIWSSEIKSILLANFHVSQSGIVTPRLKRENHMKIVRSLWDHKPSRLYSQVKCPTLLVPAWEESEDQRKLMFMDMKRNAIRLALDFIPSSKVVNMEQTMHDIPLHRPQELTDAILEFACNTDQSL